MLLYAEELFDALSDIAGTAWSPQVIHYGIPRIEVTTYPHCIIRLSGVPQELLIGVAEQMYEFEIIFRGPWDTDPAFNVELAKVSRANEFISILTQSTTLSDYGLMPTVNDVDFIESDDPNDPYYELVLSITVTVHQAYGG